MNVVRSPPRLLFFDDVDIVNWFRGYLVFTARRYGSAVLAVIVCLSVCLSVRLSVRHKSELYKDG